MTGFARSLAASSLAAALVVTGTVMPALAKGGHGPGPTPSPTASPTPSPTPSPSPSPSPAGSSTGNDISWPQCGGAYPSGQAFGIVGLNAGLANTPNSCLASELAWAWSSSGASSPGVQPKASLYVNTADPGQAGVSDWPTGNVDPNGVQVSDPYGTCSGGNDQACAWQYGWNKAIQDMMWLAALSPVSPEPTDANVPSTYTWWLDVETGNTWETGSQGLANNVADLQGMVAAFADEAPYAGANETSGGVTLGGARVGIYSTASQWGQITGGGASLGSLSGLPDWIPGARTLSGAKSNCSLASFTGGGVPLTQWFGRPYDGDYACP